MTTHVLARLTIASIVAFSAALLAVGPASADMAGGGMHEEHMAPAGMAIDIDVTKDAKMGHNLRIKTSKFTWAPAHASGMHVAGEGHAHLFIDGKKITRVYGEYYYLGTLSKGRHTVRVTLNGNDHADYVRNEKALRDSQTLTVA